VQNRAAALSGASAMRGGGLTCTQRYHGADSAYEELPGPVIVNRGPAEPFELMELVQDFQREHNLPSFDAAWQRAKIVNPGWFFATA
jgi:hypothetical protein